MIRAWSMIMVFGVVFPLPAAEPTPNSPDEAVAKELSYIKAGEFLDAVNLKWTREKQCLTCHTNLPYMLARATLDQPNAPAPGEIRKFLEDRAANWDTKKPRWDTEVVVTAVALAGHDAATTGKLHPLTRQALDKMWTLQRADGAWNWLKCDWPPMEHDDYYGATLAAVGVGIAPGEYQQTPAAQEGLKKLRAYFEKTKAPDLHHRTMLLWASAKVDGLLTPDEQKAIVRELRERQREDGGWSLPSLGMYKRRSGEMNDPKAPSDGYATGLVVYVLRQSGLPTQDPAIVKAVQWLQTHQRESGRWFTRSLNNDKSHYITNAGTAFAVMALKSCESRASTK